MQNKVVLAITGASGSIYAKQLIEKLLVLKSQWEQLSVVMTENAKTVWETELSDRSFEKYPVNFFTTQDFTARVIRSVETPEAILPNVPIEHGMMIMVLY